MAVFGQGFTVLGYQKIVRHDSMIVEVRLEDFTLAAVKAGGGNGPAVEVEVSRVSLDNTQDQHWMDRWH